MQIIFVFILLFLDCFGYIKIKEMIIKVLIPSAFGEIFGMGFLVVKYLFDRSNNKSPIWKSEEDI
jgi:hypothetical protein